MVHSLNFEQRTGVSFDAKRGRLLDGLRQLLADIFGNEFIGCEEYS